MRLPQIRLHHLTIAASLGSAGSVLALNTYFLDPYRKLVNLYQHGEPLHLSPAHQKLGSEVLEDMKVKDPSRYKFFYCFGQSLLSAGSPSLGKAIIGLPFYFQYESVLDSQPSSIVLPETRNVLDWMSEDGEKFLLSIILSAEAQKFGMAKEAYLTQKPRVLLHAALVGMALPLSHLLGAVLWPSLKMRRRSVLARGGLVGSSLLAVCVVLLGLKDSVNCYWERKADAFATNLGPQYRKGSLEFYTKMRDRYIALYRLGFDNIYTAQGNIKTFIRYPTLPVSSHLYLVRSLVPPEELP